MMRWNHSVHIRAAFPVSFPLNCRLTFTCSRLYLSDVITCLSLSRLAQRDRARFINASPRRVQLHNFLSLLHSAHSDRFNIHIWETTFSSYSQKPSDMRYAMKIRARFGFYRFDQFNLLHNSNERLTNKMEKEWKKKYFALSIFLGYYRWTSWLKFGRIQCKFRVRDRLLRYMANKNWYLCRHLCQDKIIEITMIYSAC